MTSTTTARAVAAPRKAGAIFGKLGILYGLIVIVALFSFLRPASYPTIGNVGSILQANAPIILISLGLMLTLIVGHFDLSVAANAAFSGVLAAGLMSREIITNWVAVLLVVLLAAAVTGLVNGVLVALLNINSLVATLATQSVLYGLILWFSGGMVIYENFAPEFLFLGQGRPFGVPMPFIVALVIAVVLWFVLYHRPLGRKLYAIGGNVEAAKLVGIKSTALTIGAFVFSGVLAGLGGALNVAQTGAATPGSGADLLLPAIAACFLGETSIRNGFYNVWGTFLAVLLVSAGTSGLFMIGAEAWVQPVFHGLVLAAAVILVRVAAMRKAQNRLK